MPNAWDPESLNLEEDVMPLEAAGDQVMNSTAVLELHIGTPGFKKSIDSAHFMSVLQGLSDEEIATLSPEMKKTVELVRAGQMNVDKDESGKPDPSMIRVSQDLIDKRALKAIGKHDKRFTNWIKNKALPSPLKFQGAYLMRSSEEEVNSVSDSLEAFAETRKGLVQALGQKWDATVADAKPKRGPFFTYEDYPPFNTIGPRFVVEYRWLEFNVPAAINKAKAEIQAREGAKAKQFFVDAAQETRDAARVAFQGLTAHLLGQLGNDENGKPKRFMGNSVDKMMDFIQVFLTGGDLTGDGELKKFCLMAKDILGNVDPSVIRKNETVKDALKGSVEALAQEASKLVVVSHRKFALGAYEDPDEVEEPVGALEL